LVKILNSHNLVATAQGALHFAEELHSILALGCHGQKDDDDKESSETEPTRRKDEHSHALTRMRSKFCRAEKFSKKTM